jgi:hypothetical protein
MTTIAACIPFANVPDFTVAIASFSESFSTLVAFAFFVASFREHSDC